MKNLNTLVFCILFSSASMMAKASIEKVAYSDQFQQGEVGPDSTLQKDTLAYRKVVVSRYWVKEYYKQITKRPSKDIEKCWLGLYYSGQYLGADPMWKALGRKQFTQGFALQFMSGNILKGEVLALYGGVEWGMQFYGSSKMDTVLINSEKIDRGFTYMYSHTNDLMARLHLEYAMNHWAPYLGFGLGTRIFTTANSVDGILASSEYKRRKNETMDSESAMMGTLALGARFKLVPRIHLDLRYEQNFAQTKSIVNYQNTTFNGEEYLPSRNTVALGSHQWKIGFVFDLSTEKVDTLIPAFLVEQTKEFLISEYDANRFIPCTDTVESYNKASLRKDADGRLVQSGTASLNPSYFSTPDSFSFYKDMASRRWVPGYITYHKVHYKDEFGSGRFGFSYAFQNLENSALWDSIGRPKITHGFALQLLSKNLLKKGGYALNTGLEWGFQYYGKSESTNFAINLNGGDEGKSNMFSFSSELFALTTLSYKSRYLGPYVLAGFGAKTLKTKQIFNQDHTDLYDSSETYRLGSVLIPVCKVGIGTRIRLSRGVYLDVRHDWNFAPRTDIINFKTTTFDGSQYQPKTTNMNMNSGQTHIGMTFNFSKGYRETVEYPGRYEPEYVSEIYIDSDSTFIIKPCTKEQRDRIIPEKIQTYIYRPQGETTKSTEYQKTEPEPYHYESSNHDDDDNQSESRSIKLPKRSASKTRTPAPKKQDFPGLKKPTKKIEN